MSTAVRWEYLQRNPVQEIKLPPGKSVKRAPVLSLKEMGSVIGHLEEPYRTMVTLASATGMRESELLALKWEDFDLKAQFVRVRRSLFRGRLGEPKTEESQREIPYGTTVKKALENLQGSERKGEEFLFVTVFGNLFNPDHVTKKVFRPLAAELGLPAFTWRSFRRSAETALHTRGVPLKVQQQLLGHANPNMTLVYADPGMKERRAAVKQIDRLLLPTVTKTGRKPPSSASK